MYGSPFSCSFHDRDPGEEQPAEIFIEEKAELKTAKVGDTRNVIRERRWSGIVPLGHYRQYGLK